MYIENINSPADVKKLNIMQLNVLAEEMRHALLTRASKHGSAFQAQQAWRTFWS